MRAFGVKRVLLAAAFLNFCPWQSQSSAFASAMAARSHSRGVGLSAAPTTTQTVGLPRVYLNAKAAAEIDELLMKSPGFSIDQLMELAGLSVATAAHEYYQDLVSSTPTSSSADKVGGDKCISAPQPMQRRVVIVAGPGNNGGDGLVAARHLKHFGYNPTIIYPRFGKGQLFTNLVKQCHDLGIPLVTEANAIAALAMNLSAEADLLVDAVFGFGFSGAVKEPYQSLIAAMRDSGVPTMSVDIPSGWDVNEGGGGGGGGGGGFYPSAVISLTHPKACMRNYRGEHYLGGRFVTPEVEAKFGIDVPDYGLSASQIVKYKAVAVAEAEAVGGGGGGGGAESEGGEDKDADERCSIVYITASSESEAKHIARGLLDKKLAACVNILPGVSSLYNWKGKAEQSTEVLLMAKTRECLVPLLTAEVKVLHSYEVPEVSPRLAKLELALLTEVRNTCNGSGR